MVPALAEPIVLKGLANAGGGIVAILVRVNGTSQAGRRLGERDGCSGDRAAGGISDRSEDRAVTACAAAPKGNSRTTRNGQRLRGRRQP